MKRLNLHETALFGVVLLFALTGCKTKEKLTESYIKTERKSITIRDTTMPGFELRPAPIVLTELLPGDTLYVKDKAAEAELAIWKNKYGELEARCSQAPKIITRTKVIEKEIETENTAREEIKNKRPSFGQILMAIGLFLALILAIRILKT